MSTPRRILYLDCFSGISGDMFLGAMIDLGVPADTLDAALAQLHLPEAPRFSVSRQARRAIAGFKVEVVETQPKDGSPTPDHHPHAHGHDHHHDHAQPDAHDPHHHHQPGETTHHHHPHDHAHGHGRAFREIRDLIHRSGLADSIKERSLAIFSRIAEAEAKIHGTSVEEVHFHEVGALDSIADIVGAAVALDHLQPDAVHASPLREGSGFVRCAHGQFPLPAPATAEILRGVPLSQCPVPHELITPTGAAILAACVERFGPLDRFVTEKIGYGLGSRELAEQPNVLRALLGTEAETTPILSDPDAVEVLETNLDDLTPEELALACEHALAAGALDVVVLPATMKKGRAGWLLQVLARPADARRLAELLLRHTSAFGVRMFPASRLVLARRTETVDTRYGPLPVKLGFLGTTLVQAQPEFEPARRAADRFGVPLHQIYAAVSEKCPLPTPSSPV